MSLPGIDVHIRLTPDMHERLRVLAEVNGTTIAALAGVWLEKNIVGEFHALSMQAERIARLGIAGISRDSQGM